MANFIPVVALKFTFKNIIPVLNVIYKSTKQIREISQRTKANKRHCSDLSERIQMIGSLLNRCNLKHIRDETIKSRLESFAKFLIECIEFMNTFINDNAIKRLWNNKKYLERFQMSHDITSRYVLDLQFYMAIKPTRITEEAAYICLQHIFNNNEDIENIDTSSRLTEKVCGDKISYIQYLNSYLFSVNRSRRKYFRIRYLEIPTSSR